jgi:hypothetical protein
VVQGSGGAMMQRSAVPVKEAMVVCMKKEAAVMNEQN